MKPVVVALAVCMFSLAALAEEGAEHEGQKQPPKPFTGSPLAAVLKLPVVETWKHWVGDHKGFLTAWGESVTEVEGQKCWGVAVGESRNDGLHIWRRFCVPFAGGEILVESISTGPEDDITYTPYAKWVEQCKPTESSEGTC